MSFGTIGLVHVYRNGPRGGGRRLRWRGRGTRDVAGVAIGRARVREGDVCFCVLPARALIPE